MSTVDQAPPPEPCECGQMHAVPPPRTLPVTPAERAAAPMLRAWQAWRPSHADTSIMRFLMVAFGDAAMVVGLADALDLTPAGRDLLARVEAEERTPRPMPAYLASFPQGPVAPDPDPSPEPRKCPVCLAITYRDDGIAYCTDHEPQLSERARKALAALSLAEPRDFAGLKCIDLLRVDGCGTKTRAELLQWAGEHGAHLIHRLPKRERDALASKEPAQ